MGPGWPTLSLVPPLATLKRAGEVIDHAVVKRRKCKGSVAKSLSIEIVRVVFALLSNNTMAFLQECQHACALPATGCLRTWATPRVGRVGPKSVCFFMENRNSFLF